MGLVTELALFHFLRPEWLLLLPSLSVLEFLLRNRERSDDPFQHIIAPSLLKHLRLARPKRSLFSPDSALAVLIILLTLVLAGPSWRQQPSPLAQDNAPLVIVIDVSESMQATDVEPSRGERARQKLSDLLMQVSDKQVGIVAFAGSAHTVLPLTNDHDIARNYLSGIRPGMAPRAGKYPEYALPSLDRMLARAKRSASVLLISDGVGGDSSALFKAWCSESAHQLIVYGIGSPDPEQSASPLDERGLQTLASGCGARYIADSVDTQDIDTIVSSLSDGYNIIDNEALPWLDSGYPLVFVAMALALLWFRRGWTRVWTWLLLPCLLLPQEAVMAQSRPQESSLAISANAPMKAREVSALENFFDGFVGLWLTPDQYGRLLLEIGYSEKAARFFNHPIWQATAHYYAEDFTRAALLFARQDSLTAHFNRANALAHNRDYVRALGVYKQLLTSDPRFPGAQSNHDKLQALVDEINRLSQSQQQEDGVGGEDIDEQDAQIGEGARSLEFQQNEREQYTAEELLASPETAELWLKGVQHDPERFLRTKFSIQLKERGVSE